MNPADLLRKAADRVETLDLAVFRTGSQSSTGIACWAETGPQIAAPLAAWLRAEAIEIDRREQLDLVGGVAVGARAIEVARALLGETGET